jgi:hypothetical protein
MVATAIPSAPKFSHESERLIWDELRRKLRNCDVLLHGVRFTDHEHGEVEIDLLVLMPDSGAVAIEVKGGKVSYREGGWKQTDAHETRSIDPARQARNGVYSLRRFLQRQPSWSRGQLRAGWMIALPHTHITGDLGPEGRRDVLIGEQDIPEAAGLIYDRLQRIDIQTPLPSDGWVDAAVALLVGTFDKPAEIAERTAARLEHVDQLTAQQSIALDMARMNRLIEFNGSAGTGKTWLAIEQAKRWTEAGERVAFVSYTRGVIEMVNKVVADLPEKSRPAFVGTFHLLGFTWGATPPVDADSNFWEQDAVALTLAAGEALPNDHRFTAFVVDEAQDFADSWWPALLSSAASPDFKLAVFRDDEQTVFSDRRGRPDLPLVPLVLSDNLRNSRQIVDTFRPLVDAEIIAKGGSSFPVEYIECAADEVISTADDVVADLLENRGWLPEHVALLTTQHRHPVHVELGYDKTAYWKELWATDDVFYSTVVGFKGLERPAIVLAVDGFHPTASPRGVMYTGMSRARDLLIIVGPPGVLTEVLDAKTMRRLQRGSA